MGKPRKDTARLTMCVRAHELRWVKHAASLRGLSLTEYVKRAINASLRQQGVDATLFREMGSPDRAEQAEVVFGTRTVPALAGLSSAADTFTWLSGHPQEVHTRNDTSTACVSGQSAIVPYYESEEPEYEMWQPSGITLMGLFKQAARDETLTDHEVRNIVRYLSADPINERDIQRTRELAALYGWKLKDEAEVRPPSEPTP